MTKLAASRTRLLCTLALIALLLSGCAKAEKLAEGLTENAVSVVEFFPKPDEFPPKTRIHYNFHYTAKGDRLLVIVDDWRFNGGRKNSLVIHAISMDDLDGDACQIGPPDAPVGPVSYSNGKQKVSLRKVTLHARGGRAAVEVRTFDRGRGKYREGKDRWRPAPDSEPSIRQTDRIEIFTVNEQAADRIVALIRKIL